MSSSSHSKQSILPSLNFDSESEDEQDSEATVIFHPKFYSDNKFPFEEHRSFATNDSGIDVSLSVNEDILPGNCIPCKGDYEEIKGLTFLGVPPEIEIDHALIHCGKNINECIEDSELTDSGNSCSSLLGKLEEAMVKLGTDLADHNENDVATTMKPIQQPIKFFHDKMKTKPTCSEEHIHQSVTLRYGGTPEDETTKDVQKEADEIKSLFQERSRLKQESEKIIQEHKKNLAISKASEVNIAQSMIQSVDSMLENVSRIIYEEAIPSDDMDVKSFLHAGLEHCEKTESFVDIHSEDEREVEPVGQEKSSEYSIDTEANVEVIDWSVMLNAESCIGHHISTVEQKVKNFSELNVSTSCIATSVFTNSFLSAIPSSIEKPQHEYVKVSTKPKRDILGIRKKSLQLTKEIESSNESLQNEREHVLFEDSLHHKNTAELVETTSVLLKNVKHFKEELLQVIQNDTKEKLTNPKLQRHISFDESAPLGVSSTNSNFEHFSTTQSDTESKISDTCVRLCNTDCLTKETSIKKTRSTGCSTDSMLTDLDHMQTTSNCVMTDRNDSTSQTLGDQEKIVCGNIDDVATNANASKGSKNKKKKKKKNKTNLNNTEIKQSHITDEEQTSGDVFVSEKKQEFIAELEKLAKQEDSKILFDKNVSFKESYSCLPSTNKQLLLLKVALDSPGMCKQTNTDALFSYVDTSSNDNFIGLVTLFVSLLQGSRWELTSPLRDIPFDVVSMQQVFLDGDFFLMVGVAENQNTLNSQIKTKRSKLGTNFFQAVTHYLNTHSLEGVLEKIWQKMSGIIWNQIESNEGFWKNKIPGTGKLSSLISILPDSNALQRILAIKPSLFAYNGQIKLNFDEVSYFSQPCHKQEYTCITISNLLAISPKLMCEFLLRLREESVVVCGLKIAYEETGNYNDQPVLVVGIYEVKAHTVNEGRLLLSDCEQLKDIPINFMSSHRISSAYKNSPVLNYVINDTCSHREVVRWFGPRFAEKEVEEVTADMKVVTAKNQSKSKKKSFIEEDSRCIYQFLTYLTYGVLLVSTKIPSDFLAFVIAVAGKRGLQLKALKKNAVLSTHLNSIGVPQDQANHFGYSQANAKKPSSNSGVMNSFFSLLFHGNNTVYRLYGLIEKLTFVLNNPLTGETLETMINEPSFCYQPSHNVDKLFQSLHKLHRPSSDYFISLNYTQATQRLFSNNTLPNYGLIEDVFPTLSNVGLKNAVPELLLTSLVVYGKELINTIPSLFFYLFNTNLFENLKTWRESSRSSYYNLQYSPCIELLGLKYLSSISKHEASFLALGEMFTKECKLSVETITGQDAVLLILRNSDQKSMNQLKEKLSKAMPITFTPHGNENLICHFDVEYVVRLMFKFFHPDEIHTDSIYHRTQSSHVVLPEQHPLFTFVDKVYNLKLLDTVAVQKTLTRKGEKFSKVNQLHPLTLSYPLQLIIRNEQSFAGLTVKYSAHEMVNIIRAIARVCRIGFQISALNFPASDRLSTCVKILLKREDAIFVLSKLLVELESQHDNIQFTVTNTPDEVLNFIKGEFKLKTDGGGGVFYPTYAAMLQEIDFVKDPIIDGKDRREIDWSNIGKSSTANSFNFMRSGILNGTILPSSLTEEVNVVMIPSPLLNGVYLNKVLPLECTFPEVWHRFESINYRTIAAKMTMLDVKEASNVVDALKLKGKRKSKAMYLMSRKPFVAIVLIGPCVLSDFWMNVSRKFVDDDAVNELKKHLILPSKKEEVEMLMCLLFDKILDNDKVEIKTQMV